MNLPENYIVICNTREETNSVMNSLNKYKEKSDRYWLHWNYVCIISDDDNIFNDLEQVQNWFKNQKISKYKTFTFKEWKKMKENPFKNYSEVNYKMITTHPYFKTLDDEKLIEVLRYMDSGDYKRITGNNGDIKEKLEGLKTIFKQKSMQKLTISVTELLEIHIIACSTWKTKIAQYLTRVDENQNIRFTQKEVDEMFKAATGTQKPVLIKIFGEKIKPIVWDKIKTGSKVMIKYTGESCGDPKVDYTKSVEVVFFKTPYHINHKNIFSKKGYYNSYCTFHQDGNYILCSSNLNTDYITEVIEY